MPSKRATIPFIKMHGLGNDFVVIDDFTRSKKTHITVEIARRICDRRFGIGADQILWLKKPRSKEADVRMDILNADGSRAEMCGNGIRAVALYLSREVKPSRKVHKIETLAGILEVKLRGDLATVNMGKPVLGGGFPDEGESLRLDKQVFRFYEVSVGNPHAVLFVEDTVHAPVETIGPLIEKHPRFPDRTNVEFVQITGPRSIRVRVWERGVGITMACGTGACAAAVAALARGRVQGPVNVELPGGHLSIYWPGAGKAILMEGPAEEVFRGEFQV